jgi:hypothetical protein
LAQVAQAVEHKLVLMAILIAMLELQVDQQELARQQQQGVLVESAVTLIVDLQAAQAVQAVEVLLHLDLTMEQEVVTVLQAEPLGIMAAQLLMATVAKTE